MRTRLTGGAAGVGLAATEAEVVDAAEPRRTTRHKPRTMTTWPPHHHRLSRAVGPPSAPRAPTQCLPCWPGAHPRRTDARTSEHGLELFLLAPRMLPLLRTGHRPGAPSRAAPARKLSRPGTAAQQQPARRAAPRSRRGTKKRTTYAAVPSEPVLTRETLRGGPGRRPQMGHSRSSGVSAMAKEQGGRVGTGTAAACGGTQEGESVRTLCEPQINVSVWHTPSAGVGDTRLRGL